MATPIVTKFTRLLNITSPIVSSPMAYAATPAMVAAVVKGGGFGFLGAGRDSADQLARAFDETRAALGPDKQHLFGVNYVGWVLDKFNTQADPRLRAILERKPGAIWFAYGDVTKYIREVREFDASHDHKTLVFVTVNTTQEALRASRDWKADVIVAQGAEAGGRGSTYSPPIKEFLKDVVAAIPDGPPVLAAGGITTGTQIAALLTLGAAGVVVGTRFLLTHECMYPDAVKQKLLEARADATARSAAYDVIFPPGIWPDGIQARCLKNGVIGDFEKGVDAQERKAHVDAGGIDHTIIYAGVGVGDITELSSTEDVMRSLHNGAVSVLRTSAPQLLGSA